MALRTTHLALDTHEPPRADATRFERAAEGWALTGGLALGWAALVLAVAYNRGGALPDGPGAAIAVTGALGALGVGCALVASGRLPAPRATPAAWTALGGLAVLAAVSLASTAWSITPAASWGDAV